jgi:DNA topoisomerase-1
MNIERKNINNNFFYFNKRSKKKINDINLISHIKSLKIPPAYTDVSISSNKSSKIQAIGTDTKKRKQYIYNTNYVENQKQLKFSDLIFFGKKIKKIRKDYTTNIEKSINNGIINNNIYNKNTIISIILYLIDKCNFRVGCEKYKKLYNSYGATTLNKNHININNSSVNIEFIGKKGVINKSNIKNKNICAILEKLCSINNSDYLFYYKDDKNNKYKINEKHINDYLKKYNNTITVKMFRTWSANYTLLRELLAYDIPKTDNEAIKNVRNAIKKAAKNMHHSTNVSKKSYMNNEIIDMYLKQPEKFSRLINFFRKKNGELPNINRLLNLILKYLLK